MTSKIIVGIVCLAVGIFLRPFLEHVSKWIYSKIMKKPLEEDKDLKTLEIILSFLTFLYKRSDDPKYSNECISDILLKIHDEAQVLESKRYTRIQNELTQFSNMEPTIRYATNMNSSERSDLLVSEAEHLIKEVCNLLDKDFREAIK